MCLIIQATKPEVITENMMNCAYLNNDDGFGLMFANKGKVHVHKLGKPKSFKSINKLWDSYKNLDVPMGLHFRFNTNGESSKAMSHPYQVLTKEESNRDIWLMHNGPQLPTPMIDSNKSDTHQFVKWVLRPQLLNEPELLYNPDWQEMLSDMIGSDKLLFLDSKTEEFTIINEEQGKTTDDMWLSNTYSLEPRGNYALSRDYKYDQDTDTLKKIENKWTYEDDDWGYNSYGGISSRHYGHYNNGVVRKTTPLANGVSIQDNKQLDIPLPKQDADETMWNGKALKMQDLYQMDKDEIIDLCEDNPVGVGCLISEEIVGNRA